MLMLKPETIFLQMNLFLIKSFSKILFHKVSAENAYI